MAHPGKWITSVTPSDRVGDAARECLRVRFAVVQDLLPAAALDPDDAGENVHQLRVAVRRAVAAIDLFDNLLPRKKARQMRKRLKRIRQAAGPARDLDVLRTRITEVIDNPKSPLALDLTRRRKAAQLGIVKVLKKSKRQRLFTRQANKLLERVWPRGEQGFDKAATFGDWSRWRLRGIVEDFFDQWPSGEGDYNSLHCFRIRNKKLRYSVELLTPAFASNFRKVVYPLVEELQDFLGTINDHATAAECFGDWQIASSDDTQREQMAKLAECETKLLSETMADFHKSWSPQRGESLRRAFIEVGELDETG